MDAFLRAELFLLSLPDILFFFFKPFPRGRAHGRGDDERAIEPGDQEPGAASLRPCGGPGFNPLPSWLQPELPPELRAHAWPPERPEINQTSTGAEPGGAAGAEEEDQQQGAKANAGPEHCHGRPEGGHGALRLLAIICLLLPVPPARGSSGPPALQDLHPGSGQELHPPPGFISAGDAAPPWGGECRDGGQHRAGPTAAARWRLAPHLGPQSAPPHPGVPAHLRWLLLIFLSLHIVVLCW